MRMGSGVAHSSLFPSNSFLIVPAAEWLFDDHEVLQVQHLRTNLVVYATLWHLEEDMDNVRVWLLLR